MKIIWEDSGKLLVSYANELDKYINIYTCMYKPLYTYMYICGLYTNTKFVCKSINLSLSRLANKVLIIITICVPI